MKKENVIIVNPKEFKGMGQPTEYAKNVIKELNLKLVDPKEFKRGKIKR